MVSPKKESSWYQTLVFLCRIGCSSGVQVLWSRMCACNSGASAVVRCVLQVKPNVINPEARKPRSSVRLPLAMASIVDRPRNSSVDRAEVAQAVSRRIQDGLHGTQRPWHGVSKRKFRWAEAKTKVAFRTQDPRYRTWVHVPVLDRLGSSVHFGLKRIPTSGPLCRVYGYKEPSV